VLQLHHGLILEMYMRRDKKENRREKVKKRKVKVVVIIVD
jgi:hypothetical protein